MERTDKQFTQLSFVVCRSMHPVSEDSHWEQPLSTATDYSHWVLPLSTAYSTVDSNWLSQNQKRWESNWLSKCMLRNYECIPQCQLCMTLDWSVWFFICFSWDNAHMYICTILINSSTACTVMLYYLCSFIPKHNCRRVNYSAWCSRLTNLCLTTYLSHNAMILECVQRVTCACLLNIVLHTVLVKG